MDYKEKYEQALERCRKLYNEAKANEYTSDIDDYENIFPELAESEDERVRKEITELVMQPTWKTEKEFHRRLELCAWLEKQGEQPRYSIGDVLCDKSCTTLNKDAQPNFEIVDIRNGMYICDKGSFPISQQDEYELVAKKIEQKTAWSEEDECYMAECINAIATKDGWSFEEKRKTKHWLKSLKDRYTWRPSNEQLNNILDVLSFDNCTPKRRELLESLYEQLKKL